MDILDLEKIAREARPIMTIATIAYVNLKMWHDYFKTRNLLEGHSKEEIKQKLYGGERSWILRNIHDRIGWFGYNGACYEYDAKKRKREEFNKIWGE